MLLFFIKFKYWHFDHVENMTKENRDERLMKSLMDHCNEKLVDRLDDKILLKILTIASIIIAIHILSMLTLISIGL